VSHFFLGKRPASGVPLVLLCAFSSPIARQSTPMSCLGYDETQHPMLLSRGRSTRTSGWRDHGFGSMPLVTMGNELNHPRLLDQSFSSA
jgi:hypothetical protein